MICEGRLKRMQAHHKEWVPRSKGIRDELADVVFRGDYYVYLNPLFKKTTKIISELYFNGVDVH